MVFYVWERGSTKWPPTFPRDSRRASVHFLLLRKLKRVPATSHKQDEEEVEEGHLPGMSVSGPQRCPGCGPRPQRVPCPAAEWCTGQTPPPRSEFHPSWASSHSPEGGQIVRQAGGWGQARLSSSSPCSIPVSMALQNHKLFASFSQSWSLQGQQLPGCFCVCLAYNSPRILWLRNDSRGGSKLWD